MEREPEGLWHKLAEWLSDAPSEGDVWRYEERLIRVGRRRPIPEERLREIARRYVAELLRRGFERDQFEELFRDPELPTLLWNIYCRSAPADAPK